MTEEIISNLFYSLVICRYKQENMTCPTGIAPAFSSLSLPLSSSSPPSSSLSNFIASDSLLTTKDWILLASQVYSISGVLLSAQKVREVAARVLYLRCKGSWDALRARYETSTERLRASTRHVDGAMAAVGYSDGDSSIIGMRSPSQPYAAAVTAPHRSVHAGAEHVPATARVQYTPSSAAEDLVTAGPTSSSLAMVRSGSGGGSRGQEGEANTPGSSAFTSYVNSGELKWRGDEAAMTEADPTSPRRPRLTASVVSPVHGMLGAHGSTSSFEGSGGAAGATLGWEDGGNSSSGGDGHDRVFGNHHHHHQRTSGTGGSGGLMSQAPSSGSLGSQKQGNLAASAAAAAPHPASSSCALHGGTSPAVGTPCSNAIAPGSSDGTMSRREAAFPDRSQWARMLSPEDRARLHRLRFETCLSPEDLTHLIQQFFLVPGASIFLAPVPAATVMEYNGVRSSSYHTIIYAPMSLMAAKKLVSESRRSYHHMHAGTSAAIAGTTAVLAGGGVGSKRSRSAAFGTFTSSPALAAGGADMAVHGASVNEETVQVALLGETSGLERILTLAELERAIWQIAANCVMFNAPETYYPQTARQFAMACVGIVDRYCQQQLLREA